MTPFFQRPEKLGFICSMLNLCLEEPIHAFDGFFVFSFISVAGAAWVIGTWIDAFFKPILRLA